MGLLADRLPGFSSERLIYRPLMPDHATALQLITNDPSITNAISFLDYPFSLDDSQAFIKRMQSDHDRVFGGWMKTENQLVSVIGAHLQGPGRIEIGYWIGSALQGKGYGFEAAQALLGILNTACPDHSVFAECAPANGRSVQLLEKLGFVATGAAGVRPGRGVYTFARHG